MILNLVQELCRTVTSSHCAAPRWSQWRLVAPSTSTVSLDVADIASGGVGAAVPVNVKLTTGSFSCGLENEKIGLSTGLVGYGGGGGLGAGWGVPFVGGKVTGSMSKGSLKTAIEKLGGSAQGKVTSMGLGAVNGVLGMGPQSGTTIVAGPNAPSTMLQPRDFHGVVSLYSLGANFVINGIALGIAIWADEAMIMPIDLAQAKAFGLFGTLGMAASLELEASGLFFSVSGG